MVYIYIYHIYTIYTFMCIYWVIHGVGVAVNGAVEEARLLEEAIREWETLPPEERGNRPTLRLVSLI
jgi:hypothetical protein